MSNVIPMTSGDLQCCPMPSGDKRESFAAVESKPSRFSVARVDQTSSHETGIAIVVADATAEQQSATKEQGSVSLTSSVQSPTEGSQNCDSHDVKSLRYYTREALPRADHYRNILSLHGHLSRPTLDELHEEGTTFVPDQKHNQEKFSKNTEDQATIQQPAVKFGWIQGVLVRCLLNIWGVMLFLRLSWVIGQAGIGLGCLVILLASAVTTLTALSMSAICTNGEVRGGGTYYMISRSLGPEFGGAIGLIFALANAVAIAMYTVGFAETVLDVMKLKDQAIVDGGMNDVRIISCCTVVVLLGIAIIGTEWESKAQLVLLVILLVAMIDFLVGSFFQPTPSQQAKGFMGWSWEVAKENFGPDFRGEDFFSVFAIFFPAATGILAGANISGDLKDPQKAIPQGTLLAIFLTTISYVAFAVVAGFTVIRDANGLEMFNTTCIPCIRNCSLSEDNKCSYGLMNHYQVMELVSAYGPLIYSGIFAATLSSALASLVSAPKVFQALSKDKLFPYIHAFAKGYGRNNEPRKGYLLSFLIGLACCALGDLNAIAPIISNFFLAAYCLINFSCFHASFAKSPGFRPAFKYYNMWLSLLGAILCLVVMFIMYWWAALTTFAIVLALYIYILYRKPDVNWGSSTQAQTYRTALNAVMKLNQVPDHVKNYRPQVLVLTGSPSSRPPLVDFAYSITRKLSLMICGHVMKHHISWKSRELLTLQGYQWLQRRKVRGFYTIVEANTLDHGVKSLIQSVGIGKLRPNVVLMGYKNDWQTCDSAELLEYFNVIHDVFDLHMSLGILRLKEGLDYSNYADLEELSPMMKNGESHNPVSREVSAESGLGRNISSSQLSQVLRPASSWFNIFPSFDFMGGSSRESSPTSTPVLTRANPLDTISQNPNGNNAVEIDVPSSTQLVKGFNKDMPKEILININKFQHGQKKGTIDVWWLYDDGGLTMLLPYLLTTSSQWNNCKLRVFALANKKDELDREQRNMAALLSKFRIDYSNVTVIPDIVKPPQDSSKQEFQNLIKNWVVKDGEEKKSASITESELLALKDKTNRHIRLRELLCKYSGDATLIVMTLPMPRKGTCSASLYMAWLEMLTHNMPPFLLIRGNQTSVLTFYS